MGGDVAIAPRVHHGNQQVNEHLNSIYYFLWLKITLVMKVDSAIN